MSDPATDIVIANNEAAEDAAESDTEIAALSGIYAPLQLTVNAQTGTSYTVDVLDNGKFVTLTNAAGITCTLPQDSDEAIPIGGQVHFAQLGAGQVTFAAGTGATVNAQPGLKIAAQYGVVTAIKRAANTWILVGALAA
jgi:hypothetical protein